MKKLYLLIVALIIVGAYFYFNLDQKLANITPETNQQIAENNVESSPVTVLPISHATMVLNWAGSTIYIDPTGGAEAFKSISPANFILITDIHGDHLSTSTLQAVTGSSTLIVPQAVRDLLPSSLSPQAKVMNNGQIIDEQGFRITAMPMYNLPESPDSRHTKGRGNGYIIEREGYRVYIAGDTAGIREMRELTDINIAFVPMNLPFTMTVEEAADAVLDFKPKKVYPYHYRGQNGLTDVNRFKQLVNAGDPNIEVILENWYPAE